MNYQLLLNCNKVHMACLIVKFHELWYHASGHQLLFHNLEGF
jgi:hypothetical protein